MTSLIFQIRNIVYDDFNIFRWNWNKKLIWKINTSLWFVKLSEKNSCGSNILSGRYKWYSLVTAKICCQLYYITKNRTLKGKQSYQIVNWHSKNEMNKWVVKVSVMYLSDACNILFLNSKTVTKKYNFLCSCHLLCILFQQIHFLLLISHHIRTYVYLSLLT